MILLHLRVLILLGVYPRQSPILWPKWHMLCVRIRSNLASVCTKLNITLNENAVKMTNTHTWVFLSVNICFVALYLQEVKNNKKHNWKNQKHCKNFQIYEPIFGKEEWNDSLRSLRSSSYPSKIVWAARLLDEVNWPSSIELNEATVIYLGWRSGLQPIYVT